VIFKGSLLFYNMSTKESKRTIMFDLDGTVSDYSGGWAIHGEFPGEPFPESVDAIKKLKDANYIIGIYTTRPNELVEKWLDKYELTEYVDFINDNPQQPEGASHKPIAHAYIDDRAIRFDGTNMGEIVEQIMNGGFAPWQNQQ